MALDVLVSQIAYRARLLERALHDDGPWSMEFCIPGSVLVNAPATKRLLDDGVVLSAEFIGVPGLPGIPLPQGRCTLYLRDEPVAVFSADGSLSGFTVTWAIRAAVVDESRQP